LRQEDGMMSKTERLMAVAGLVLLAVTVALASNRAAFLSALT